MAKLTVMVGIPGSGKSTIAHRYGNVISTDTIRKELLGSEENQANGDKIFSEAFDRIHALLRNGLDCVFDATNVSGRSRARLIKEFPEADEINAVFVNTPLLTCIKRNNSRDRKVPLEVIKRMYKNLEAPSIEEGFDSVEFIR